MFKRLLILFMALTFTSPAYALNLSRVKTWSTEVLTADDLNAEFDNILNHQISNADVASAAGILASKLDFSTSPIIGASSPAAGTFTALTSTGDTVIGNAAADALTINSNTITFEGATTDAFHDILTITDPTANNTITIPNANSVTLPTGAIFYMISGSCPAGTTDVSSTYSNKFIKINATAGTSSAGVFTTTSDGTAITQANVPSYNLTFTRYDGNGSGLTGVQGTTNGATAATVSVSSGGSGTSHTHTISSATTNEPSSVTAILCQVS